MTQSNYLEHYGVKGMRWGHRKDRYQGKKRDRSSSLARTEGKSSVGNTTKGSSSSSGQGESSKFQLSEKQKRALKIGAAVAGTALVAYGGYKVGTQLAVNKRTREILENNQFFSNKIATSGKDLSRKTKIEFKAQKKASEKRSAMAEMPTPGQKSIANKKNLSPEARREYKRQQREFNRNVKDNERQAVKRARQIVKDVRREQREEDRQANQAARQAARQARQEQQTTAKKVRQERHDFAKNVMTKSDKEVEAYVKRLSSEKKARDLTDELVSPGRTFAKSTAKTVARKVAPAAATAATTAAIGYTVSKATSSNPKDKKAESERRKTAVRNIASDTRKLVTKK